MTSSPSNVQPQAQLPTDLLGSLPCELDPQVALILIDFQEFIRKLPYTHPINEVAARAGLLAEAFRARGLPVVTTLVAGGTMPRSDRRMQLPASIAPKLLELMPELAPAPDDLRLPKQHWGAFTGTQLEDYLRSRQVTNVVIAGVATGFGVESTARHASELGFNVTIATDAITDMDAEVHNCAVQRIFPAMAQCRSTASILAALQDRGD